MASTRDKLSELRDDAVVAWRIAINLTRTAGPIDVEHIRLALIGAVQAQARYTLTCNHCVQCGHRMINHSIEDPARVPAKDLPDGFEEDCECCVAVSRMMRENDDG